MASVKIKICGITSPGDARMCLESGADYLGFNFYPPSPRYIEPHRAREIVETLKTEGFRNAFGVGLFVDTAPVEIRRTMDAAGLEIVQLSGNESAGDIARLKGYTRIKSVKMTKDFDPAALDALGADIYLADTPHPTLAGGTGEAYDYSLAREAARRCRLFLAGGLTPETVARAIQDARPFGVDVATGVEIAPGRKDPGKVAAFCSAVRKATGAS
jgi:phosphoribosylanthranilate isomerase